MEKRSKTVSGETKATECDKNRSGDDPGSFANMDGDIPFHSYSHNVWRFSIWQAFFPHSKDGF